MTIYLSGNKGDIGHEWWFTHVEVDRATSHSYENQADFVSEYVFKGSHS